jgi:23S rRNA pseudouridine1911/1915/1917 synthase
MRWIVRPGEGSTIRDVLARAGADARALPDGRVFLGRRRLGRYDEAVRAGDVIEIAPPREVSAKARVLLRTEDMVAVDKPADMPTIADHAGAAHALVAIVAAALGVDASRLHPTSRLDRDVSGVVVLALTKDAADRLARARESGAYERRYVAIASGVPEPALGHWDASIGRANEPRLRAVDGREAVPATTRYAVCARSPGGLAMLAVAPVTGRTHQIRVHASHAGVPLVGDRRYGGPARLTLPGGRVLEPRRIALHAARVVVPDARGAPTLAIAPVPGELIALWSALGGAPSAWQLCASCELA